MKSTTKIVLICLVGVIFVIEKSTALKCASCVGTACTNPTTATILNCTDGAQDTCIVISVCGYAERACGIKSQYCTVAGFKQNQAGAYNGIASACSNINKQLQDSDIQSALTCCQTDACNDGSGNSATLAALLICFGIALKLI